MFNFSDLLEPYISLLVWRHSLGLSGWMTLSEAWALWRLCVSDFYQEKPIRPDRGMMILGHHHSGDTAPTNPTTPSSIRQPKTPSHAPSFPRPPTPLHLLTFLLLSLIFPSLTVSPLLFRALSSQSVVYFHCFISFHLVPLFRVPPMANPNTNFALFLAHETFNISFQFLADAGKK